MIFFFKKKKSRIHYASEQLKTMELDFDKIKENTNESQISKSISNVNKLSSNSTDQTKNQNSLLIKKGVNFEDFQMIGVPQANNKKQKK